MHRRLTLPLVVLAAPVLAVLAAPSGREAPRSDSSREVRATASPAAAAAGEPAAIMAARVADGLSFPLSIAHAPGDADRVFVVEQIGFIRIYSIAQQQVLPTPFLDIDALTSHPAEKGLLDVAFDPDWAKNGFFYIVYNRISDGNTTIARYSISADPNVADAGSEVVLETIPQSSNGHQSGQLHFGPDDGYLYVTIGDDSRPSNSDPANRAQDLGEPYGKMFRLDVDAAPDYIPGDNPFVDDPAALDEIWSYGLRNPWRFSFDRLTGDMYIGEVGKGSREEINFEPAGGVGGRNYGWRCMEGTMCTTFDAPCTCNDPDLTLPVHEQPHGVGDNTEAIIGGYVYRGLDLPELAGRYFFGNYCVNAGCNGYVKSLVVVPDGGGGHVATDVRDHTPEVNPGGVIAHITSFGEDDAGELYFTSRDGFLYRIVRTGDINADGVVSVDDLVAVIVQWGPCPAPPADCGADVNNDGEVDVNDLVAVIVNWTA